MNLAVIALRLKQPGLERPYRMPVTFGHVPLFPVLGIVLVLVLAAFTIYALVSA